MMDFAPPSTDALGRMNEALYVCELIHMAARALDEDERNAIHAGIDQVSYKILLAQAVLREPGSTR